MKWLLIVALWNTNPPQDSFKFFTEVHTSNQRCEDRLQEIYAAAFDADKILLIEKFNPEKIVTAVYLEKDKLQYNVKRFKIETTTFKLTNLKRMVVTCDITNRKE